jgi:hypothetical protein
MFVLSTGGKYEIRVGCGHDGDGGDWFQATALRRWARPATSVAAWPLCGTWTGSRDREVWPQRALALTLTEPEVVPITPERYRQAVDLLAAMIVRYVACPHERVDRDLACGFGC